MFFVARSRRSGSLGGRRNVWYLPDSLRTTNHMIPHHHMMSNGRNGGGGSMQRSHSSLTRAATAVTVVHSPSMHAPTHMHDWHPGLHMMTPTMGSSPSSSRDGSVRSFAVDIRGCPTDVAAYVSTAPPVMYHGSAHHLTPEQQQQSPGWVQWFRRKSGMIAYPPPSVSAAPMTAYTGQPSMQAAPDGSLQPMQQSLHYSPPSPDAGSSLASFGNAGPGGTSLPRSGHGSAIILSLSRVGTVRTLASIAEEERAASPTGAGFAAHVQLGPPDHALYGGGGNPSYNESGSMDRYSGVMYGTGVAFALHGADGSSSPLPPPPLMMQPAALMTPVDHLGRPLSMDSLPRRATYTRWDRYWSGE
ncbi:hypothetical protein BC828DRAFT_382136 [Blastocladiella britannica]|nr:hypothetical protein BC828DRAFT_382136 [Blastocladiella britannica]